MDDGMFTADFPSRLVLVTARVWGKKRVTKLRAGYEFFLRRWGKSEASIQTISHLKNPRQTWIWKAKNKVNLDFNKRNKRNKLNQWLSKLRHQALHWRHVTYLLNPAFSGRDRVEREHCLEDVGVSKAMCLPNTLHRHAGIRWVIVSKKESPLNRNM